MNHKLTAVILLSETVRDLVKLAYCSSRNLESMSHLPFAWLKLLHEDNIFCCTRWNEIENFILSEMMQFWNCVVGRWFAIRVNVSCRITCCALRDDCNLRYKLVLRTKVWSFDNVILHEYLNIPFILKQLFDACMMQ